METTNTKLYSTSFILVCISSLFFSASYNMLIPELPNYISGLGGAEYKGLIIALFTLTAGLSRPFSGKLTDTVGRKPIMIFGALVCIICGVLYPILTTVSGFLFLRLLHGFSTGFSPTAIAAYVSDIIPKNRLGEAMGIQGLCFSSGLALGPALGSYIKLYTSYTILFYSSSLLALLSIVLIFRVKETLINTQKIQYATFKIAKGDIIAKEALPSAVITFVTYLGFGVILTLIPDWSEHLTIINKGTFFIVFTFSSLFIRMIAGKVSDKYGRIIVIQIGLIVLAISLVLLGYLNFKNGLLISAAIYGLAMGILSPTINAWTIDLSNPLTKGKSIATMYIALEAGIGLGAFFSGWYYRDDILKIPITFYICAFFAVAGLYYITRLKRNKDYK
ncbi:MULTISPECIES: MFS transporter [unclassified Tenacibaculum]|uniref:MFS transporter n=1 Tax=unclassified Tenacibaculum TaxID=2635139 RepID=UPI001F44E80D|nr:MULTISPECIES: MFS transporter [unclassified Tenacibaculum]MCF2875815.1 MFS transporter [Tenacibaculum sp. Cn5-1]MCF2935890.1 MFS transporter [Tenacibaculum sp. Cn5-34]MCG7512451.1 MFS transporter [Tenacibaculum sp. Cn5-46]